MTHGFTADHTPGPATSLRGPAGPLPLLPSPACTCVYCPALEIEHLSGGMRSERELGLTVLGSSVGRRVPSLLQVSHALSGHGAAASVTCCSLCPKQTQLLTSADLGPGLYICGIHISEAPHPSIHTYDLKLLLRCLEETLFTPLSHFCVEEGDELLFVIEEKGTEYR